MMPGNKNDENRISAILHNTKQKYNELATSLVLTSSLISHKNKIHKIRQIKFQTLQQSPF
jgi:DNA-binding Xre family transcriptional regulator